MSKYPMTMTKGRHERLVESATTEMNLRHDGWRAADEPPVERGGFLPPVTSQEPGQDPAEPGEAAAGAPSPAATRRRGKTATSSEPSSGTPTQ